MIHNPILFVLSIVFIVVGSAMLMSCLSPRNYQLIHEPCPRCECPEYEPEHDPEAYEPSEVVKH